MKDFLTEDEITNKLAAHLKSEGWDVLSRAMGHKRGADIIAQKNRKILCIEAKGGGSQTLGSKRYGQSFPRLQCQQNVDVAFSCLPRMLARYNSDYVGIVLHDDQHHFESVTEILPAIKKLGAGLWLVGPKGIRVICKPKLQN